MAVTKKRTQQPAGIAASKRQKLKTSSPSPPINPNPPSQPALPQIQPQPQTKSYHRPPPPPPPPIDLTSKASTSESEDFTSPSPDPDTDPGGCSTDAEAYSPPPPHVPLGPIKTRYRVFYDIDYSTSWDTAWHDQSEEDVVVGTYSCRKYANGVAKGHLLREWSRESFDEEYTVTEEDGLVRVHAVGMESCTFRVRVERVKVRKMAYEVDLGDIKNMGKGVAVPRVHDDDEDGDDEDEEDEEEEEEDE